ncbi:MAG: helix-turn-helix domain-containing protein [Ignavibacteria bacterium]
MVSSSELTQTSSQEISTESLRLLSVNEARELLRVRHDTVKKLIEEGKIEVLIIGKRTKIPYISLKKFVEENARTLNEEQKEEQLATSREFINKKVDSIINKHTRRN